MLLAVAAAIVVVAVFGEGEEQTVIVPPSEETSRPTGVPTRTPAPLEGMRALALSTLTVRAGPGTDFISLGIARRGAELEVVGKNSEEDWLEISYPPRSRLRGWVSADGVELEGSVASLPMATPESLVLPAVPTYPPSIIVAQEPTLTPMPETRPAPDLILSDAYLVGAELLVTVTNQGTADTGPTSIDVAIYGGDGSTMLRLARVSGPLPAGASVDLATQYQPAGGPQRLLIRVDPANRVEEMSEDNNEVVFGVSGLLPSPTASTSSPTATGTPSAGLPTIAPTQTMATGTPTPGFPTPTPTPTTPTRTPTSTVTALPMPAPRGESTPASEG